PQADWRTPRTSWLPWSPPAPEPASAPAPADAGMPDEPSPEVPAPPLLAGGAASVLSTLTVAVPGEPITAPGFGTGFARTAVRYLSPCSPSAVTGTSNDSARSPSAPTKASVSCWPL